MIRQMLALGVAFAGALGSTAAAQCLGPDGLSGPCWVPAQTNLPSFPGVTLPSTGICWDSCQPQQQDIRMVLDPPQLQKCGQYSAELDVFDTGGAGLVMSGFVNLDYTRTWEETSPGPISQRVQVFRFVAKVDLRQASTAPSPCLLPSCFQTWPAAFYYGYVDYAFNCATGNFTSVIALYHNCDAFIHDPSLSSAPAPAGGFHPDKSYGLVGPSSGLNPFVASILTPPAGPIVAEALRNVPAAAGATCITEDPLQQGRIDLLGQGCGCKFNVAPPQLTARHMDGLGACVNTSGNQTSFTSVRTWPNLPWFEVMTTSMGAWTTDATYPGKESAWVDEGTFLVRDACSAALGGAGAFAEIYYGASTSDGWLVTQSPVGPPLTQNFTDLASNLSFKVPGAPAFPFVGNVLPTRNLIYVNVP